MATTIPAKSAGYQDVVDAIAAASPGDTVKIPPGTVTWGTATLSIDKPIHLMGSCTIDFGTDPPTCGDETLILDSLKTDVITVNSVLAAGDPVWRVSHLSFKPNSAGQINDHGTVMLKGSSHAVRLDHCHFLTITPGTTKYADVSTGGSIWGVADHNVHEFYNTPYHYSFTFHHESFPYPSSMPGTAAFGNGSWNSPTNFGGPDWFFVEDSYFKMTTFTSQAQLNGTTDDVIGARWCWRHNRHHDTLIGTHGTEGGVRRGGRAHECYNNHWTNNFQAGNLFGVRTGCLLSHDNTVDGTKQPAHMAKAGSYRLFNWYGTGLPGGIKGPGKDGILGTGDDEFGNFCGASGDNPWDVNDITNGTVTPGQTLVPSISNAIRGDGLTFVNGAFTYTGVVNGLYGSGTVSSASTVNNVTVITVQGSPGWVVNQWNGFVMHRTAMGSGGDTSWRMSYIISNTANTLNVVFYTSTGSGVIWSNGDTFTIHRALIALDQCGRGECLDQIKCNSLGQYSFNVPAGNIAQWPRQRLEPWVNWNDRYTLNGTYLDLDATGVDGKYTRVGHEIIMGTTTMPVVPGVTAAGGSRTSAYTPYDYPHPLVSGTVTQSITSDSSTLFTEGVGGTFQATSSGFTAPPIWTKTGTLPTGTSFNSSGLLTVGAGSVAGTYPITITATNGSETASQNFSFVVAASVTKVISLSGSLAFGNVDINTTSAKTLSITNTGNTVLTVTAISFPSGFSGNWTSGTVAPGATQAVIVTFAPIAATSYSGTITVTSDKTSGTNTASPTGTGTARVIGISGSLSFGSITTGQTATRQMTIANTGNATLTITAITYPTGYSGDFSNGTVAAGGTKVVNVTFSPTLVQSYPGSISVTSNANSGTNTISVSGTGTAAATKIIQLTGSLDFGTVETGTTPTKTLTITNSGNSDLAVSGITYPTGFTGSYSGTIAAGASHNVTVTFSPVAAISYSGTVTVASDATDGIDTTTASGTGTVSSTKIISLLTGVGNTSFSFGNVNIGSTAGRVLVITNNGSVALTVSSITYPTGYTGAYSGVIAPGASQNVTVTFTPTDVLTYSGTITVVSDKTSGTNTIDTTGAGVSIATKIISISANLSFGNVQKHHSSQRIMTVVNSGTAPLTITNIVCPTGFSVSATTGTIPQGSSLDFTVTFSPTTAQAYGGSIIITSDKTSGVNTIACSGTGTNQKQVPFVLIVG